MLKKINEGGVESDTGFSIQITGPECLRYKQKNFFVDVDLAYEPESMKIYIYASKIKYLTYTNGRKDVSDNDRRNIETNIKESIKLLKGNFVVV